jgi:hypothetical protein
MSDPNPDSRTALLSTAGELVSTMLVFPIDVDSARPIVRFARSLGWRVIAASSVPPLPANGDWDASIQLPFISDMGFDDALRTALRTFDVTHLVTMHVGVWAHLARLSETDAAIRGALCGAHPVQLQQQAFAPSLEWGRRQHAAEVVERQCCADVPSAPPLSVAEYSSIHRGFLRTYGQSDEAKLEGLCSVARRTLPGDVVELGVFYGRSAYALARLANAHRIGSTLCIDAWGGAPVTDQGAAAAILNSAYSGYDQESVFEEFLSLATEVPGMSYIRDDVVRAVSAYRLAAQHGQICAPGLQPASVAGTIALLHVDANHRYDQVRSDVCAWEPLVRPGGWIILDDYIWAFGDGPKRVGDELLASGRFDCSYTCSDSLFLRKRLE